MAPAKKMERWNQCDRELIEIDNHGERLVGCLTVDKGTKARRTSQDAHLGWRMLSARGGV